MIKHTRYTKSENTKFKELNTHLKVLEERAKHLRAIIRNRKKRGHYNASDPARVLKKIKQAKKQIADATFI